MYEIRPESVKSFITDKNIRLPRFQRKQTWDEKKNFELCISLFKEYPLGVSIVNVEVKNGINIRWLLDGRQRRNALLKMYEDPNNIYEWAKKYIKFKNNTQPDDLREMFWTMINDYVEYDDDNNDEEDNTSEQDEDSTVAPYDPIEDDENDIVLDTTQKTGLDFLLEIILMIHNKKKGSTGFTRPFDISSYVEKLKYLEMDNHSPALSSKKLKSFIDQYRAETETYDPDSLYGFVDSMMNITNSDGLKKHIQKNWQAINTRIKMIDRFDSILSNSKIGIIEVKEIQFADSQKIFNIINTKGEKLTAVEVLSAKPSWNTKINYNDASSEMKEAVSKFYKALGISVDKSIVKWDLPATLLTRIGKNIIIQDFNISEPNALSKLLTYGFKLLAGIWESGIKKDDIDRLSKDQSIDWLYKYDSLVEDIRRMLSVIESFSYFSFFKTWRTTIMELTNDSIALDFLILAFKDWERKGKPTGSDSNKKSFVKNCFILWDTLIYEYLTLKWKGSGDSKIGRNIAGISNTSYSYTAIPAKDWITLLKEILNDYKISGEAVTVKNMKPILYHFYCLKSMSGPDTKYEIEVDHIIPQEAFKTVPNGTNIQNSLYNLGLLPKRENISKSKKRLNEIHDTWLKAEIVKYEFVKENQFDDYSDIVNHQKLFNAHYKMFAEVFDDKHERESMILN